MWSVGGIYTGDTDAKRGSVLGRTRNLAGPTPGSGGGHPYRQVAQAPTGCRPRPGRDETPTVGRTWTAGLREIGRRFSRRRPSATITALSGSTSVRRWAPRIWPSKGEFLRLSEDAIELDTMTIRIESQLQRVDRPLKERHTPRPETRAFTCGGACLRYTYRPSRRPTISRSWSALTVPRSSPAWIWAARCSIRRCASGSARVSSAMCRHRPNVSNTSVRSSVSAARNMARRHSLSNCPTSSASRACRTSRGLVGPETAPGPVAGEAVTETTVAGIGIPVVHLLKNSAPDARPHDPAASTTNTGSFTKSATTN